MGTNPCLFFYFSWIDSVFIADLGEIYKQIIVVLAQGG